MHADIADLREFYYSPLGQMARRLIRRRIRQMWPSAAGLVMVGIGHATPYLRPYRDEAERTIALAPAGQGVAFWPTEGPGLVALTHEYELPLPDLSVDRVLLVHGLEGTEHLRPMLREIWRIMAGGGRLLVVVPNRRGVWARAEWTPFGHGTPCSVSQLKQILRDTLFLPERTVPALFIPPLRSRFCLAWAPAWEEIGVRWFRAFAGVTMIEASKEIFAGVGRRVVDPVGRRLSLPFPSGSTTLGLRRGRIETTPGSPAPLAPKERP